MQVDFVRVAALVEGRCLGCVHNESPVTACNMVNGVYTTRPDSCHSNLDGTPGSSIWKAAPQAMTCKMSAHKAEYRARALDPATSKGTRKVNKYEQCVVELLGRNPVTGLTGKQMAQLSGFALNCITPRFAPLRRKDLIKDSGVKRDKQIVWVLA